MLATLLLILQLVGAIPAIIEAVKAIWALISKVESPKMRRAFRKRLHHLVHTAVDEGGKTLKSSSDLAGNLLELKADVINHVARELEKTSRGPVAHELRKIRDTVQPK